MVNVLEKQVILFEKTIYVQMAQTDEGIQVLIAGGDRSHVGAVTVVGKDGERHTLVLPGHKEAIITEKWADKIFAESRVPVVVTAGIHFDHITSEQIKMVLHTADQLLDDMILCIIKSE